jgi:hypothetical protein
MAWLPMYLLKPDIEFLNDWLNQEDDIAFLVSNGSKKWIARKEHNINFDIDSQTNNSFIKRYSLWHIASGALPLLGGNSGAVSLRLNKDDFIQETIADPWKGWTEKRTGADSSTPYFGAGHPGIFHLTIKMPANNEIPISGIEWIGNHYRIIGNGADKTTEAFWNKLRRMAKKVATQIPRCNDSMGRNEIYAFPKAYEEIRNGRPCSLNP